MPHAVNTSSRSAPAVIVTTLSEARSVLACAARVGTPVLLVTEPGAADRYGPGYLLEMMRQAARNDACTTALIDCGDSAGQTMLALRLGWRDIHATGAPDVIRRIAEMADSVGARFHRTLPACLRPPVDQSFEQRLRDAAAN